MSERKRSRMPKWGGTLAGVAVVLCLPLLVPVALARHAVARHRLRAAAGRSACLTCGQILGPAAVRLADEAWAEQMRTLQREHPGLKVRVIRMLQAVCPACDTRYRFRGNEGFVPFEPARG